MGDVLDFLLSSAAGSPPVVECPGSGRLGSPVMGLLP